MGDKKMVHLTSLDLFTLALAKCFINLPCNYTIFLSLKYVIYYGQVLKISAKAKFGQNLDRDRFNMIIENLEKSGSKDDLQLIDNLRRYNDLQNCNA